MDEMNFFYFFSKSTTEQTRLVLELRFELIQVCGRKAALFPAISISVWEEKALRAPAPAPAATEAGAELRRPYLSLQNQLLGEQHGLLAERLRLLQTPRRVPGPPRALDTWRGREGGGGGASGTCHRPITKQHRHTSLSKRTSRTAEQIQTPQRGEGRQLRGKTEGGGKRGFKFKRRAKARSTHSLARACSMPGERAALKSRRSQPFAFHI